MREDAGSFGACYRDNSIRGVIAEGKKRCEAGSRGRVTGASASHDDGPDFYLNTKPMLAEGVCKGVYLLRISCAACERSLPGYYFDSPI
jgi:hypothetical protein